MRSGCGRSRTIPESRARYGTRGCSAGCFARYGCGAARRGRSTGACSALQGRSTWPPSATSAPFSVEFAIWSASFEAPKSASSKPQMLEKLRTESVPEVQRGNQGNDDAEEREAHPERSNGVTPG